MHCLHAAFTDWRVFRWENLNQAHPGQIIDFPALRTYSFQGRYTPVLVTYTLRAGPAKSLLLRQIGRAPTIFTNEFGLEIWTLQAV